MIPSSKNDPVSEWLLWQQQLQPFFFKEDLAEEIKSGLAKISAESAVRGLAAFARPVSAPSVQPAVRQSAPVEADDPTLPPIERVRAAAARCNQCRLSVKRTNMVFGEGNLNADIMFVGEGPGEDEDLSGRPFVGRAGQLLTKIIENGMKIPRDQVYIANVVKCRPPGNRDPLPDEAECCIGFLKKQIEIINPKVIILLGRIAANYLLGIESSISKARENTYQYNGIKTFVTYHPSALLRNETYKRPVWEDIKKAMKYLGMM